jgi:hypothetical protein
MTDAMKRTALTTAIAVLLLIVVGPKIGVTIGGQ